MNEDWSNDAEKSALHHLEIIFYSSLDERLETILFLLKLSFYNNSHILNMRRKKTLNLPILPSTFLT